MRRLPYAYVPRIFDNIEAPLLDALRQTLLASSRADVCIGYFNLRGWAALADPVEHFAGGDGACARVLIGMHRSASDELREALRGGLDDGPRMDNGQALRLKKQLAAELREQLTLGAPTDAQERALLQLAAQIRAGKVRVKLFLRHALHAKLYLCHTGAYNMPAVGFVGSSNLTFSGLQGNGELNVDVLDHDACEKLGRWFEDRWTDRWCLDVSDELVEIIETSWVRPVEPYHIYLKIAYHLAEDARKGLTEFTLPKDLRGVLFDYQEAAVKLAARRVHERRGVVIGDVVGLGKTLMATALARLLEEDLGYEPLVLAPKHLVSMWEDYAHRYGLRRCKVLSVTRAPRELPDLRRYRLVIIDESHNLRNREGKRYRAIRDYVQRNDSRCVLLTATPYNKTFQDLSAQLRLFLADDADLGIRPEAYLRLLEAQGVDGEVEFGHRHNAFVRSVAAFEASDQPDDWRELMRLFMVRRTRSFVKAHYALADCPACAGSLAASDAACLTCGAPPDPAARRFLRFPDGTRSYFPERVPKTVTFETTDPADPYGRLYDDSVVSVIEALKLPRYGLAEYLNPSPQEAPTPAEQAVLDGLGRSGRRLVGFARTGLFKRLESSAEAFLLSVGRHALRNAIVAHAIGHGLAVPLGTQDAGLLDPDLGETDDDDGPLFEDAPGRDAPLARFSEDVLRVAAARVYERMRTTAAGRFTWVRAGLFRPLLRKHLLDDARALLAMLERIGPWEPAADAKLAALVRLVRDRHPSEKVLVFSQFADTVRALGRALDAAGVARVGLATGASDDPTALAHRFSPTSNGKTVADELRVLLATDVLSEGQNLQDAHLVVNFDLPWALIRLIQRAGRVDRIGQAAEQILCYTFFPAEGVEKIIRLRERIALRMAENAEVVGSDERFFEDVALPAQLADLYHEKAGMLDGDDRDGEVDIASQAHAIWQGALRQDPRVKALVENLPDVVHATRRHAPTDAGPEGVLVYTRRTARARAGEAHHTDALAWLDRTGRPVTESPLAILKAAECAPGTPGRERLPEHHELVARAVGLVDREGRALGGQLGRRTGARFRAYERLSAFLHEQPLFATDALKRAVQALYTHPLTETATDTLGRQLRAGLDAARLAELVVALHDDDRLAVTYPDGDPAAPPQILCSLGLAR